MNTKKLPLAVDTFLNTANPTAVPDLPVVQLNVVSTVAVVVSSFTAPLNWVDVFVSVLSSIKLLVMLVVAPNVLALPNKAIASAGCAVFVGPVVAVVDIVVVEVPIPLLSVTSNVGVPLNPVYSVICA